MQQPVDTNLEPVTTNYQAELDKLSPEEQEAYIGRWRTHLQKLPRRALAAQLTRLTRRFGPQFAGRLLQPELKTTQVEPEPITEVPASAIQPEIPWYAKPAVWAVQQPAVQELLKPVEWYHRKWITPASMSLGQAFSPKMREEIAGRAPFSIPEEERYKIWEESNLPWLAKTAFELTVDPITLIGWGLAPKALKAARAGGHMALAKVLQPIASAEEAYIKASRLPVKWAGAGLKKLPPILPDLTELRLGHLVFRRPFQESPRSFALSMGLQSANALANLDNAAHSVGKTFSQVLEGINMGIPDDALVKTLSSQKQLTAVKYMADHAKELGLDEVIKFADDYPLQSSTIIAQKMARLVAKDVGVQAPTLARGTLGSVQRIYSRVYQWWRRVVLQTSFNVLQNTVENPLRELMTGVTPMWDMSDIIRTPRFKNWPVEIQAKAISLADRWNKTIPETAIGAFARTPMLGGATEASIGALATGKAWPASTIDAFMDDMAIVNSFRHWDDHFTRVLMGKSSPQTKAVLDGVDSLFDDAIRAGTVEPTILQHLKQVSNGSVDDTISAFAEVQKNKTMAITRAIDDMEKSLPDAVRAKIKTSLPNLWAKGDKKAIDRLFQGLEETLPQRVESYQRQLLVQRLRTYRDIIRSSVPKPYQPYMTRILNRFKYPRVSEAEARVVSAKSVTDFQRALFEAHKASRRELEILTEWNVATSMMANDIPSESLGLWLTGADEINEIAFTQADDLVRKTLDASDVMKFAKDPSKIQQAWDNYIMEIQNLVPDIADQMRTMAPDTDQLWHAYRETQEQRWFKVGQDKLEAARRLGVNVGNMPMAVDATGKIISPESFQQYHLGALKSWKSRVDNAWSKRLVKETADPRTKLLNDLRAGVIKLKESVTLQEHQIRNQASDLALDMTYSTFGNYATRTNFDEFMTGIGVPFWFFPSRSVPFYITQMIQKPRLGLEVLRMQRERAESEQPSRLLGTINIPGTDYWYNPLQSTFLWQLSNQGNFSPQSIGGMGEGMNWIRANLGVSLAPQWHIGAAIVERMWAKQAGEMTPALTGEPQPLIPQQRWLEAVAGLKLPVVSTAAGLLNEPFDMYLRAVYGDSVANWQQREVEKTIVDMGYNPRIAPKEIVQQAWNKYYIRQLLSIPGGAVKEMNPTEMARFQALNEQAKKLGLTKEQRATLKEQRESTFTGLRQDQIEAIYKDIPAQKLWRYIRPSGLDSRSKPIWEDYIQLRLGRETLLYGADKDNPTKGSRLYNEQQLDKALQAGRISPREWKSLYRQNYQDYSSKIQQLETDYPLAPKTDADWEAYRKMLDWKDPVRHPDDIKLDEYYEAMDSSNFENDLGEFDYDAYRRAQQQFFQGLDQSTISYIKSRSDKYKTPLRAAYGRDMEKVQPYYDLRRAILAQYPPSIIALIELALAQPDSAIQRAVLTGAPMAVMALRRVRRAEEQLRRRYPDIDRILRYWSS